jgi:hypothetical protein
MLFRSSHLVDVRWMHQVDIRERLGTKTPIARTTVLERGTAMEVDRKRSAGWVLDSGAQGFLLEYLPAAAGTRQAIPESAACRRGERGSEEPRS